MNEIPSFAKNAERLELLSKLQDGDTLELIADVRLNARQKLQHRTRKLCRRVGFDSLCLVALALP